MFSVTMKFYQNSFVSRRKKIYLMLNEETRKGVHCKENYSWNDDGQ